MRQKCVWKRYLLCIYKLLKVECVGFILEQGCLFG